MWIIDFLFGKKTKKESTEIPFDYLHSSNNAIFSVNAFNEWFNDPNNGALYAHSGIFLRLDKLSMSHIEDYMEKRCGIDKESRLYENSSLYLLMMEFNEQIVLDWRTKINNRNK